MVKKVNMVKVSQKSNLISDDKLNKTLKFHNIIRSVFEEDGKFYPQVYLAECYKC